MTRLPFHDGQSIPQSGFGLWQSPDADAPAIVAGAARAGYRLLDGAAIHGNQAVLGAVRSAAARTGLTPAQVILRWHLQRGLSVIPRSVTPGHIAGNLAASVAAPLTGAEVAAITALGSGARCGPDPAHFE
jgi:diketogulonate reductase-like aldo/keto reductase